MARKANGLVNMKLIVACDMDGGIGKNGTIPWTLKKDMAYFMKKTTEVSDSTKKNAVIMGRKCWESIPSKFRPLKNRINIVISRTLPPMRNESLIISPNFDEMIEELSHGPLSEIVESVWNIGGRDIYQLGLEKNLVDEIYLTKLNARFDADVVLNLNLENFVEIADKTQSSLMENDIGFEFIVYKKSF